MTSVGLIHFNFLWLQRTMLTVAAYDGLVSQDGSMAFFLKLDSLFLERCVKCFGFEEKFVGSRLRWTWRKPVHIYS